MFSLMCMCQSVCLQRKEGSDMTITHDALDLTVQEFPRPMPPLSPHIGTHCTSGRYAPCWNTFLLIQVVKMLVTFMVIFTVCIAPKLVFDFWYSMSLIFSKEDLNDFRLLEGIRNFMVCLSAINSSVNAFIYYWTSE